MRTDAGAAREEVIDAAQTGIESGETFKQVGMTNVPTGMKFCTDILGQGNMEDGMVLPRK